MVRGSSFAFAFSIPEQDIEPIIIPWALFSSHLLLLRTGLSKGWVKCRKILSLQRKSAIGIIIIKATATERASLKTGMNQGVCRHADIHDLGEIL